MSDDDGPYIPADQEPKELTLRVLVVGVLLGVLMTAANAYLGLYAGMTVSASIPAAVMSMLITVDPNKATEEPTSKKIF